MRLVILIAFIFGFLNISHLAAVSTGNRWVSVVREEGQVGISGVTNELTGETHAVENLGFRFLVDGIGEVTAEDFELASPEEGEAEQAGISWNLNHTQHPIEVHVHWEADEGHPWIRRRMRIANRGSEAITVRWVDAARWKVAGEDVTWSADPAHNTLTDYGQPVFLDSFWVGMEHPAAHTARHADGSIVMRHHPGKRIAPGEWLVTKPIVIGAVGEEGVREAFARYVDDLRYYDGPPRVYFWWNGFRVIKPPDRIGQGLRMAEYMIEKLQKPYGHVFDGFSYDAGFAMYRTEGLYIPSEEGIWEKTKAKLEDSGTELGFWTSFSCIYDNFTQPWGVKQGYGLQHGHAYCLAEPTYRAAITTRLLEIVNKYDMKVISFDGMHLKQGYGCNIDGHGHLVGEGDDAGRYGTEAVADAELDIFEKLRIIQPEINFDFFVCGEWASPWWLTQMDGVHTVPGDTVGCDFPSPALRDELITARDIQAYDLYKKRGVPFPMYASDLYGFQVRGDHLIDGVKAYNEDYPEKWENEYVLAFAGRGTITSFISCSDLMLLGKTRTGMKFLAEVEDYVRHHHAIYQRTSYLGGDPGKGEAMGYAHGDEDGRSLVTWHNPLIDTCEVTMPLDDTLGLGKQGDRFAVDMIYPHRLALGVHDRGSNVKITMNGFEVVMLDVRREDRRIFQSHFPDAPKAMPADVRFSAAESSGLAMSAEFDVPESWRSPELLVYLRSATEIKGEPVVTLDGKEQEGVIRRRSRNKREDLWWIGSLNTHRGSFQVTLPDGFDGNAGTWIRATCPPPPPLKATLSIAEAVMPTLPDDARQRYWVGHPWRD